MHAINEQSHFLFDLLSSDFFLLFPPFSLRGTRDQEATTMDVTQQPPTTAPSPCRGSGAGTGCEVEADADNNKH